ncbi:MAG: hypothetical protein J3R72DRAFT_435061 [Linnemannia gamsii]|nr:MAG: hypothetical protein J3R72DRAFT_435061 [Linnemannia gamsii]
MRSSLALSPSLSFRPFFFHITHPSWVAHSAVYTSAVLISYNERSTYISPTHSFVFACLVIMPFIFI